MRYSEEEKALWLEDWRQSGKSTWAYAKTNSLNPQTFVKWAKTVKEVEGVLMESRPCFVEVAARAMPFSQQPQRILIEKGDVKIHIPLGHGELLAVMEGLMGTV